MYSQIFENYRYSSNDIVNFFRIRRLSIKRLIIRVVQVRENQLQIKSIFLKFD